MSSPSQLRVFSDFSPLESTGFNVTFSPAFSFTPTQVVTSTPTGAFFSFIATTTVPSTFSFSASVSSPLSATPTQSETPSTTLQPQTLTPTATEIEIAVLWMVFHYV